MHGDKKIGLALGIFLVGIVGAFFFRNDVDELTDAPRMKDPEAIDDRIAERSVTPYLARRREMTHRTAETVRSRYIPETRSYDLPQFLQDDPYSQTHDVFGPSDPIPLTDRPPYPRETQRIVQPVVPDPIEPYEEPQPTYQTREYTIQPNDTLSDLAERFLGASSRYKEIYELNRDRLKSPNDIRLGQTIRIPAAGQRVAEAPEPVRTAQTPYPDNRRSHDQTQSSVSRNGLGYERGYERRYEPGYEDERHYGYQREYREEVPQPSRRTIFIEQDRVKKPPRVVLEPEPKRRRKLVLQSIGGNQD